MFLQDQELLFLVIFSNVQNGRLEAGEGGPRRGLNQEIANKTMHPIRLRNPSFESGNIVKKS